MPLNAHRIASLHRYVWSLLLCLLLGTIIARTSQSTEFCDISEYKLTHDIRIILMRLFHYDCETSAWISIHPQNARRTTIVRRPVFALKFHYLSCGENDMAMAKNCPLRLFKHALSSGIGRVGASACSCVDIKVRLFGDDH